MEATLGHANPLNSITKLHVLLTRCAKGRQELEWCVQMMWDAVRSKQYDPKTLTVSALKGTATGNKGVVALLLLKQELNTHLHSLVLQRMSLSTTAKVHFARVFEDVTTYRAMLKPLDPATDLNLEWAAGLTKADVLFRNFWEVGPC